MSGFQKFLRVLAAIAAIAAAAAAIAYLFKRHNEKMDELDAYLMGDDFGEENTEPVSSSAALDYLQEDFDQLGSLDAKESILVSMLVHPEDVASVQEALASEGYSSTYDHDGMILEISLGGPKDPDEIHDFVKALSNLIEKGEGDYIGYSLD